MYMNWFPKSNAAFEEGLQRLTMFLPYILWFISIWVGKRAARSFHKHHESLRHSGQTASMGHPRKQWYQQENVKYSTSNVFIIQKLAWDVQMVLPTILSALKAWNRAVICQQFFSFISTGIIKEMRKRGKHGVQLMPDLTEMFMLLFADDVVSHCYWPTESTRRCDTGICRV